MTSDPVGGMGLEPRTVTAEDEANPELVDPRGRGDEPQLAVGGGQRPALESHEVMKKGSSPRRRRS